MKLELKHIPLFFQKEVFLFLQPRNSDHTPPHKSPPVLFLSSTVQLLVATPEWKTASNYVQSQTATPPERNDRIHCVPMAILPVAMNLLGNRLNGKI